MFAVAATFFKINSACAQPGTLDSTFGVNGKVTTSVSGYSGDLALQPDGKIVATGVEGNVVKIARSQTNGNSDSSFGVNGKVSTAVQVSGNAGYVGATKVKVQQDGKILLATDFRLNDGSLTYFVLLRYLSDGNPDSNFGINGQVSTPISGLETSLTSLAIQGDGKILAGGFQDGFYLRRYKTNGKVDSSFGNNGAVWYHDTNDMFGVIIDILPLDNGKIIVESTKRYFDNQELNDTVAVESLLPEGSRDSSFGIDGLVFTSFNGFFYGSLALVGKGILVSGDLKGMIGISKMTKSGTIDSTFGINGTAMQIAGRSNKLLIQTNGNIVSVGNILARFTLLGTIDSTFGTNGKASNFSPATGAGLQIDEKIVTLSDPAFTVYRYKSDPVNVSILKNISITEGNTGYTAAKFKILLNHPTTSTVKVNYSTKDGTAQAGSDYVAASGTVSIKPGNLSKTVTVNVIGDNTYESNEKFSLVLSNPVNAFLGDLDSATCTIKNDDPASPQQQTNNNTVIAEAAIKLYPNPARDELNVEGLSAINTNLSIVDMQGKEVIKVTATSQTITINVKQLSPGVYYLRIVTDEKVTTLKFLKQ